MAGEIETVVESGPYGPPGETDETRAKEYRYHEDVKGRSIRDSDFLDWIRRRRAPLEVHSDGFLALSGLVEPAYECECGFNGVFVDVVCARCGRSLE